MKKLLKIKELLNLRPRISDKERKKERIRYK